MSSHSPTTTAWTPSFRKVVLRCGRRVRADADQLPADVLQRTHHFLWNPQLGRSAPPKEIAGRRRHDGEVGLEIGDARADLLGRQILELAVDDARLVPGCSSSALRTHTQAADAARDSRNRCCRRMTSSDLSAHTSRNTSLERRFVQARVARYIFVHKPAV